jgi:serine protease Do
MNAEVIGINTMIYSQSGGSVGIGFAIPINIAIKVMDAVLQGKKMIEHGYLGVSFSELTEDGAKKLGLKAGTTGMLVASVVAGGPAEKAGLKAGDILLELNGKALAATNDLTLAIGNASPGTKVTFKVYRDGQTIARDVVLGNRNELSSASPQDKGGAMSLDDYGVSVSDLTAAMRSQYRIPAGVKGAVITGVDRGGPADSAGLQEGDVIYKVNNRAIANVDDLTKALSNNNDRQNYFSVFRNGREFIIIM